jgi:hypothetical protein
MFELVRIKTKGLHSRDVLMQVNKVTVLTIYDQFLTSYLQYTCDVLLKCKSKIRFKNFDLDMKLARFLRGFYASVFISKRSFVHCVLSYFYRKFGI